MDIDEAASVALLTCLPEKSGKRYEFTYEVFKKWCAAKKVKTISENVMLAYMLERSNSLKSPSSLWCEYSMLKATIKNKENVDISKFSNLIGFLKSKNKGYHPKKSQVLTREQIAKFVQEADDDTHLLIKLLPAALKSAIDEDVSFRSGLPMNFLSNLGLVHSDKTNDIRTGFLQTLQSLMTKLIDYAPVDAAVDQIGKKFIHDSLPPFLREEEKETTVYGDGERIKNGEIQNQAEMCLATRVKLIRYNCIRMLREEDTIRIYHSVGNSKEYHEEEAQFLDIDEDLAPAIDALIHAYPEYISVEDLPVEDNIEKVQIASDLWECGILKTEEPLSYESE